jgi:hypothetical protein
MKCTECGSGMKFQLFSDDELREIASLIAGRNLLSRAIRDDIIEHLYNQIIIELRQRRTLVDNFQLKLEE